MYCKNCGKELQAGQKFCNQCGTRQDIVQAEKSTTTKETVNTEFVNRKKKTGTEHKKKSTVVIFLSLITVCLMTVVGTLLFFRQQEQCEDEIKIADMEKEPLYSGVTIPVLEKQNAQLEEKDWSKEEKTVSEENIKE